MVGMAGGVCLVMGLAEVDWVHAMFIASLQLHCRCGALFALLQYFSDIVFSSLVVPVVRGYFVFLNFMLDRVVYE